MTANGSKASNRNADNPSPEVSTPSATARQFLIDAAPDGEIAGAAEHDSAEARATNSPDYEALCRPLPFTSARKYGFAFVRLFLHTFGRLSLGIRTGLTHGFDSGVALDHVYGNRAGGITPLGRLIDRIYLNSIGWRGVRQRRLHLADMLDIATTALQDQRVPIRILDVAAGAGRYVLEFLKERADLGAAAHLRDYRQANIDAAQRLARELGLTKEVSFEVADAFDRASILAVSPKPTLAIASGLYELFPDNEPVRTSLSALADLLPRSGLLIYTNQLWHPQLELIARTLTNREGEPWIMRPRPQAEIDDLVGSAGFDKQKTALDRWGIFSVSLAIRV